MKTVHYEIKCVLYINKEQGGEKANKDVAGRFSEKIIIPTSTFRILLHLFFIIFLNTSVIGFFKKNASLTPQEICPLNSKTLSECILSISAFYSLMVLKIELFRIETKPNPLNL